MIELSIDLGDRSYPIIVGSGARHRLSDVLPHGVQRVAVVTQSKVGVHVDAGVPSRTFFIEDGEEAKSMETVEELCRGFVQMGLTSKDCVVAVGGGVVTDAAGFAAAVYYRGIAYVNVATTLLAQVDAAIGGKTAVNIPEGKNLIGAFWQPSAVLCDTDVLQSLPPREYRSGTGEMAKYHFLGSRVGMDDSGLSDLPLDERVAFCAQLKATVVAQDERDGNLRNILNYGHTLGHALEVAEHFDLRHGEVVSIGMQFAARLAYKLGRIDDARVAEHVRVSESYELPIDIPSTIDYDEILMLMKRDKKAASGLTFVLDGPAGVDVVKGIDEAVVRDVLMEMTA